MTAGDKIFGGPDIPASRKYAVSWVGMALSLGVAIYALLIPSEQMDAPWGKWLLSALGVLLFAVALWGNRYFRKKMRGEG